jgi:acetyl esterase
VDGFRLWTDEVEALRDEARSAVGLATGLFPAEGDLAGLPAAERIARSRAAHAEMTFPMPEGRERTVEGVRCRVFVPDGPARGVYLHFHGGGMVAGTPELMDFANVTLMREQRVAIVSVDYRKAPEHPFPAGPDDGVAVARWLLEHAEAEFGTPRILVGGESAGAYMTAAVALRVRDELGAIDRVEGLNLVFGIYDWSGTPSQRGLRPHDGFDILDPEGIAFFADCFLPGANAEARRAPVVSPLYADLRGLPPCLVSVGSCDHLVDDSVFLAARAAAAGVDVDLFVAPELPHAFFVVDCGLTKLWAERQAAWFEARLGS